MEWRVIKTFDIKDRNGKTYCVFFERIYVEDWGYMGMRDYRTFEPIDEFMIAVVPYRNGVAHNIDAGYANRSFFTEKFDREMAARIYKSLEAGYTYEAVVAATKKNDLYVTWRR